MIIMTITGPATRANDTINMTNTESDSELVIFFCINGIQNVYQDLLRSPDVSFTIASMLFVRSSRNQRAVTLKNPLI